MSDCYWLNYVPYMFRTYGNSYLAGNSKLVDHAFSDAGLRLERALAGRAWLRPVFDDNYSVSLWTSLSRCQGVQVIGTEVGDDRGIPAVICRLDYPAAWFQEQADGLTVVRLLHGALVGLRAIGEAYQLGPIEVRSAKKDRNRPEDLGLFVESVPVTNFSFLEEVDRRYAACAAGDGVLCAPKVSDPLLAKRQATIVESLGGKDLVEHQAPLPNGKLLRSWVVKEML